jgi:hypothetical protein
VLVRGVRAVASLTVAACPRAHLASNALAAGVGTFELARCMGTSLEMIDRHYGHLVRVADDAFRSKLDASSAQRDMGTANERASP